MKYCSYCGAELAGEDAVFCSVCGKQLSVSTGNSPLENPAEEKENDIELDMNALNKKMQLITSVRKRQEQYIVALMLSKKKKIQEEIVRNISPNDIEDENVRKIYNFIISLSNEYDINKIDILSKIQDEDMVKEITDIMYIDISGYEEKLLQDVLKNKKNLKIL